MDKDFDHKHQKGSRKPPAEPHTSASAPPLILPNPYTSEQISRRSQSGLSPNPAGRGGDAPRSHGYSSSRPVREASDDFLQSDRTKRDPQAKAPQNKKDSQGKTIMGKTSVDMQKKGFKGTRSAPASAGKPKPAQTNSVPFEVKMADFPELAGVSVAKAAPPVAQKECWVPSPPFTNSQTPKLASSWMSGSRGSPTLPGPQQCATDAKPESPVIQAVQPVVTSWANIASQPPKKLVPNDKTISRNNMQYSTRKEKHPSHYSCSASHFISYHITHSCLHIEKMAAQQEEVAPGKKKRKKKKKAKSTGEGAGGDSSEPVIYQEPPKFEDEEEFPDLTLALSKTERLITSSNTKLCNEENQREGSRHQSADQNQEYSPAAKTQPTETGKKGQKSEKASGKKSKVPMQLDIGNMLATLEKKQQSQKTKQDAKPVILTVGGGLPVVQKQTSAQKKPLWQQDKIAHNPLDSTSPLVKKGKQREVPKAKKPTPLKKVILKEREERKQRRLLEERGLLPESEDKLESNCTETEQCDANATDEVGSPAEGLDEINETCEIVGEAEETDKNETIEQQIPSPQAYPAPKIHSRKFRDYCSQMLSKDVDECVTLLLKELVRFQDRLYQKDPMKARMKRRIVMGLREVHKHLKLRKIKCVIISPNCERIQSKGGLDEALHTIIDTCREQGVPFIFALSRKALGRCVNKAVPVSLVGIFNYDGAQDYYHKMIELSSEARTAYDAMVSSLEQRDQAEAELEANTEEPVADPDVTEPEEPQYIKIWKKMLSEEYNHTLLDFEVQLRSMHLDNECTENTDDEES